MLGPNPPQIVRRPLLRVWTRPQGTVRALIARGGWAWAPVLLAVAVALNLVWEGFLSNHSAHWFALLSIGIVIAVPLSFFAAAIMMLLGRLLRGKANFRDMTIALAWAGVPIIAALLVFLTATALLPQAGLQFVNRSLSSFSTTPLTAGEIVYAVFYAVGMLLLLWGFWTHIRAIGAAQRFGWLRSLVNIALSILIVLSARTFFWEPRTIPSNSMAPTLQAGDWIFTNKLAYGYGRYSLPFGMVQEGRLWGARPERGDLIVFRTKLGVNFLDRVVGLPGDEIQITNGVLHINALPVRMKFLREEKLNEVYFNKSARVYKETLPNGVSYEIFDMVQNSDIDNTPPFRVASGHYFVLGDSRDNSVDSRSPRIGHVPYEDIVAKVGLIYFSTSQPKPDSIFRAFDNINWTRMFRRP